MKGDRSETHNGLSLKKAQVGGGERGGISASVVDPEIRTR